MHAIRIIQFAQKKYTRFFPIGLLLLLIFNGCYTSGKHKEISKENALKKVSFLTYPKFSDDMDVRSLEQAAMKSLFYLKKIPSERRFSFGKDTYDTTHMIKSMEHLLLFIQKKPSNKDLCEFIQSDYTIYKSVGSKKSGDVLFTGYYEPSLHGSFKKSTQYKFPIFGLPKDLVTIDLSLFLPDLKKTLKGRNKDKSVIPYYTRKQIDQDNPLEDSADVIAWVNDKVDLFFLHIQGSGKIFLNNGQVLNVHYHSTNGHPYQSIGSVLINNGKIIKSEVSMQSIRSYLQSHPDEVDEILHSNSSFVFFKTEKEGPIGSLNVVLTPGRSIALDKNIFPLAALAFIETKKPLINHSGEIDAWINCKRFVFNHDTGGAIKGPGRADIFCGNGANAEITAGHLQHPGKLYFLVMKHQPSSDK